MFRAYSKNTRPLDYFWPFFFTTLLLLVNFLVLLQGMVSAFDAVYSDLIVKLKKMTESTGSVELDVFPLFETVTSDVISRTAYGSSYTEGKNIFALLKEIRDLTVVLQLRPNIPYSQYV